MNTSNNALTEAVYYILLSVLKPMHGYGIMQQTATLSSGRLNISAGTLYGALSTLLEKGWIEQMETITDSRKKELLPIDASMSYIQNILVGNDSQLKRSDRYKTSIDNDLYKLESSRDGLLMKQLWIIPETFRISRYEINSISLLYDKFDNIDGKILPKKIIFETNDSSNIKIEIDYSEIKTEEKLDFPFNISKKYNKINL